jgi:hypothetical protein
MGKDVIRFLLLIVTGQVVDNNLDSKLNAIPDSRPEITLITCTLAARPVVEAAVTKSCSTTFDLPIIWRLRSARQPSETTHPISIKYGDKHYFLNERLLIPYRRKIEVIYARVALKSTDFQQVCFTQREVEYFKIHS